MCAFVPVCMFFEVQYVVFKVLFVYSLVIRLYLTKTTSVFFKWFQRSICTAETHLISGPGVQKVS